jgi:hypothetical protein
VTDGDAISLPLPSRPTEMLTLIVTLASNIEGNVSHLDKEEDDEEEMDV